MKASNNLIIPRIIFEGLDGCGKSTIARLVYITLTFVEEGREWYTFVKEPFPEIMDDTLMEMIEEQTDAGIYSPFGEDETIFYAHHLNRVMGYRRLMRDAMEGNPEYFPGSRADSLPAFAPFTVVSDRSEISSFVYQMVIGDAPVRPYRDLYGPEYKNGDISFYIQASPKNCIERIRSRGGSEPEIMKFPSDKFDEADTAYLHECDYTVDGDLGEFDVLCDVFERLLAAGHIVRPIIEYIDFARLLLGENCRLSPLITNINLISESENFKLRELYRSVRRSRD